MSKSLVVGVDGSRDGWVGVATIEGRFESARVFPDIRRLAEAWPEAKVVAVDMPMSFPVTYPRPADVAGKRFLRRQWPSLFPTMPEEILAQPTYEEALERARRKLGKGISKQSYGLRKKIFEIQEYLAGSKDRRLYEMHPELSFRVLVEELGGSITASKKTWNGSRERLGALVSAGLILPEEPLEGLGRAGADDVLDAAVGAWTARRILMERARSFPEDLGEVEEKCPVGKAGAIWA